MFAALNQSAALLYALFSKGAGIALASEETFNESRWPPIASPKASIEVHKTIVSIRRAINVLSTGKWSSIGAAPSAFRSDYSAEELDKEGFSRPSRYQGARSVNTHRISLAASVFIEQKH